ncbi:MAG TPA: HAMP domain-containing sensor histidine kinase [Polyangia bacterium]|nr:HAMP domain-containing sensor histidine kinase [Polyangia bacterium]
MSMGGGADGSRPGARARAAETPPASDLESGGRDYRRARELLWMAAHDLSAPLGAIRMHLRAKERQQAREPLTGAEWLAALGRIDRLVESAQAMIDDVLAVERLRQNPARAPAAPTMVDAERVLGEVVATQAVALRRAGCSVFVKRGDDLGPVRGRWNPVSMERLFSNLIQNVVRHAPGAPIEVSFARRDDDLQIHFADGGPGLPLDGGEPAVAFSESSLGEDGHGLGLWIVYRIVAEMGGEITMQSRAGKGLSFDIRLPFGDARRSNDSDDHSDDPASGGDESVQCGQT